MCRLLLLSLSLWGAASAAAAPSPFRSTPLYASANGRYGIRWVQTQSGACQVEAWGHTHVMWTLDGCLATEDDHLFISSTGERFWVLTGLPWMPTGPRADAQLAEVVVARLYDRQGRLLRAVRMSELLPPYRRNHLRPLSWRVKWLQGASGVPGQGPRVNAEDQVEFETVDGQTQTLSFDPAPLVSREGWNHGKADG